MVSSFPTTVFIVAWTVLISIGWVVFCFVQPISRKASSNRGLDMAVPSLVLGPILLVSFYQIFSINIIFPVQILTDTLTSAIYCLVPAATLFLASGLCFRIRQNVRLEYHHWIGQGFSTFTASLGGSPKRRIARLVTVKSFLDSWSQSLPWFFGEILVVESLYNVPGLGLEIWHAARQRDIDNLLTSLVILMAVYGLLWAVVKYASGWLGVKLATYP